MGREREFRIFNWYKSKSEDQSRWDSYEIPWPSLFGLVSHEWAKAKIIELEPTLLRRVSNLLGLQTITLLPLPCKG